MRVRGIRHPYLWGRDHPLVVDTLIALLLAAFGVLTELTTPVEEPLRDPDLRSLLLTLAATLPLVARRHHPTATLLVVGTVGWYHSFLTYPGGGPVAGLLFALYAVAVRPRSRRNAVGALVGTLMGAVALLVLHPVTGDDTEIGLDDVLVIFAIIITAWVIGDNMRIRRAYVAEVEEKAERLERERDIEAQRAVLQERGRIAREMHDIVAHSMSVMLVQAGAARRTLERNPHSSAEAIGHIEATGRQAMDEMRRLIGVLREEGADADRLPQPGIDDIEVLVAHCRDAGLDVDVRTEGTPRPLPSGLELVVYRVVQEALTNTMKHAGPAQASVVFEYCDDEFRLTVADDGRGAATTPPKEPGHGLAGMRERVLLYGGELHAGPQVGGGFRVQADLPVSAVAASTAKTSDADANTGSGSKASDTSDTSRSESAHA